MKWEEWSVVADDAARWQNHAEKGLLKAEYVRDYVLRLWFEEESDDRAIDIAHECIRFFCEKYGKKVKVAEREGAV
jgi:hypothetical protein